MPLAYGYDGESIYAHSGPGKKLNFMRANPLVTIEVDEAAAPDRWSSVIAEGVFEELTDGDDAGRRAPLDLPEPQAIPELGGQTVVYRIRLTTKSGRYETPE